MGAELAPGMLIGRYQLLFRLGKGGMGEVWAAGNNHSALGFRKLVALKVMRTLDVTSNAAVMFFDEAKAASVLQHAAIVNTTDLGQDGDILYIAMDLVKGPSLTALLQRLVITKNAMTPAMVAHIGIALASALDYAHARALVNGKPLKLVHRDVSPHNVLLGLNGSIRLTDFGVARTAIQDHESRVGTVRGKPSYMSPEQVVGGTIDGRCDLFALGIVLYESACLKRLFGRSQPVKSMDAVMKHVPKPVPDVVPDFPQTLWSVIRKALKKDPNSRFESAAEMCAALTHAAQGLEGFDSAGRELVDLVHRVFEPGAFDTDARVQEAIDQLGPQEVAQGERAEQQPALTVAGPQRRRAEPDAGIQVVAAPKNMAWPSADASDPLSPEALEVAHTAYRPVATPIAMAALPMRVTSGSMDAVTPYSTQQSFGAMQARKERSSTPALVATAAALVLVGTTAFVIASGPRQSTEVQTQTQRARPSAAPGIAAQPRITAQVPRRTAPVTAPAQAQPDKKLEPAAKVRRTRPAPQPAKVAPAPTPDATFNEVRSLVKKVRAIDGQRGKEMFATMMEAGRTNQTALNTLRTEAQRILRATP